MPIITVTLNNKNFQLACSEDAEQQLYQLAAKLNERVLELKKASPSASFELLLVMAALSLQDQVQTLHNKLELMSEENPNNGEKFAETLSTIAGYLESLAQKIGK